MNCKKHLNDRLKDNKMTKIANSYWLERLHAEILLSKDLKIQF